MGAHFANHPVFAAALTLAASAWMLEPASAVAKSGAEITQECLDCHDGEESVVKFADDATLAVAIDTAQWKKSVHGAELKCTDCHSAISDHPHPEVKAKSLRAYQVELAGSCKQCHYAYHTKVLDSIHYKELEAGNLAAPTCTDCHGIHGQTDKADRLSVADRCARCHGKIARQFKASVHGQALGGKFGADVPTCTDCHGAHQIRDPRLKDAHASAYQTCGKCHAEEDKMKRHDLSPQVVTTYLDDFHGRSNQMYAKGAGRPGKPIAGCSDCHGVHDIQSFRGNASATADVRGKVIVACRKCHEDAPVEFADAWLSHYPPTLKSAPLVWGVQWAYRILIPLIMAGLVLHILLHLYRARVHR